MYFSWSEYIHLFIHLFPHSSVNSFIPSSSQDYLLFWSEEAATRFFDFPANFPCIRTDRTAFAQLGGVQQAGHFAEVRAWWSFRLYGKIQGDYSCVDHI